MIPKNAQTFEEVIIEAALKKTVEEHQKSLKMKKDDIVSKDLSKDILLEAVKQSLTEETFQIETSTNIIQHNCLYFFIIKLSWEDCIWCWLLAVWYQWEVYREGSHEIPLGPEEN